MTAITSNDVIIVTFLQAELTISITVLTYMVSFVFSLLVESPALGLEKVLLGNRKQL